MQIAAPLNHDAVPTLQFVEVATSLQIPAFHIVGLPNPEVAEAKERIRAAVDASGLEFPRRRVVLNLSPASIRKRGTGLDLAMALAVLEAGALTPRKPGPLVVAWGEFGLDGTIKAAGQLTRAIYAAWGASAAGFLLARSELKEAARAIRRIAAAEHFKSSPPLLIPCETVSQAWERLLELESLIKSDEHGSKFESATETLPSPEPVHLARNLLPLPPFLARALCVAAAGVHHLLLLGPRGSGKSHALEWLVALLPATSPDVSLNHCLLRELAGCGCADDLKPGPVRRVSTQARPAALIGGAGAGRIRPGEFSLAHGGILVADEFPEWPRDCREALRQPLEQGRISITRAQGSADLPANFLLAANGNLCPCGGWPPELPTPKRLADARQRTMTCQCAPTIRRQYLSRISGPILDRMDLVLMTTPEPPEPSAGPHAAELQFNELSARVREARAHAINHWGAPAGRLDSGEVEALLAETRAWKDWQQQIQSSSLRSRHKIARVALTLASLDGKLRPEPSHLAEASWYRAEACGLLS